MALDITDIGVALGNAKKYTDQVIQLLPKGFIYKGAVNYQSELPINAQIGDCYTVLYKGTEGTIIWNAEFVWGKKDNVDQWIKLGEDIKDVSVSPTGTSSNDVRYITIGDTESRFASVALRAMKSAWKTGTTKAAATAILNDPDVIEGDGFLATVYWTDLPEDITQAEVKAFVLKKGSSSSQKIIQFECTSGTVAPYSWFYNSYEGQWRSQVPINNTLTSTSTNEALSALQGKNLKTLVDSKEASDATILKQANVVNNISSTSTIYPLSANMGKELQDQVNNLKARGRYLSIWNCTTGLATTEPTVNPYTYKTGDFFIVGIVGSTNYKPNGSTYDKTVPSTTVESGDVKVNDTYYYDGTTWTLLHTDTSVVAFSTLGGSPYDNTNLSNALNSKQATITSSNKLSADLISNGSTNKVVTQTEKNTWNNKSTVSVNASGTATDEVQYITIDGVEKKLAGGGNWGSISGNIGDQQDLKEALDGKSEVNVGPCIIVKAPSGSSVSVTNGTTTYAITMTSNEYYCYLNRRGSWTVTYDGKTQTINVTENKDYIANFIATIMGVSRDITSSTSVLTRTDASVGKNAVGSVGNTAGYSDFDTMPIFKDIELVTLESDDKMVKIPKFYYKRYREGNIEYEKITDVEVSGFTIHPAFVRGDNVLDYIYVGAYKTSSNNQSKSGKSPQVSQTRATFRNNARAKGNGWSIIDFSSVMAINTLIKIEFANLNIQSVIGEGCSGKSSATATGTCDSVPNHTGRPAGTSNQVDVVWRGIEGWWGNVWEWVDGLNMNNGSYLVCNDISLYADDTATNYEALGFSQPSGSGYISKMGYDATKSFAEMPIEANGGATVSYSDQVYVSSGWKVFERGGDWGDGSGCGLFAALLNSGSSFAGSDVGSRLLKLPL